MYRQLNRRIKRVNQLADEINQKISDLNIAIKQKEIVHKALERKRTKEERRAILLVLWSLMLSIQMSPQVRHSLLLFTADWRHHLLPKV